MSRAFALSIHAFELANGSSNQKLFRMNKLCDFGQRVWAHTRIEPTNDVNLRRLLSECSEFFVCFSLCSRRLGSLKGQPVAHTNRIWFREFPSLARRPFEFETLSLVSNNHWTTSFGSNRIVVSQCYLSQLSTDSIITSKILTWWRQNSRQRQ